MHLKKEDLEILQLRHLIGITLPAKHQWISTSNLSLFAPLPKEQLESLYKEKIFERLKTKILFAEKQLKKEQKKAKIFLLKKSKDTAEDVRKQDAAAFLLPRILEAVAESGRGLVSDEKWLKSLQSLAPKSPKEVSAKLLDRLKTKESSLAATISTWLCSLFTSAEEEKQPVKKERKQPIKKEKAPAVKKNRPGQRERRRQWEILHGSNANHIKPKPKEREMEMEKEMDFSSLHPSWQAKKKLSASVEFAGKKTVFGQD